MSKEKFIFELKMSMQLFWFNDECYFNRDIEHLEKRAESIYDVLVDNININSVEYISTYKNSCEFDSDRYHIIFNIRLNFVTGESVSLQKCLICDSSSCFKL